VWGTNRWHIPRMMPASFTSRRTPEVTSIISMCDSVSIFSLCTGIDAQYHTPRRVIKLLHQFGPQQGLMATMFPGFWV